MPTVTLPDNTQLDLAAGATVLDVAEKIGPGLAKAALGARIFTNGEGEADVVDMGRALPGDCRIEILTTRGNDPDALYMVRHSCAHVMAEAICKIFPSAKLVYGPPVEDGFYYDIDLDDPITPEVFERIEKEMKAIIKERRRFTRYEMGRDEARAKLEAEGNRYKVDNAERAEGDVISFYVTGEDPANCFEDLCRGPHVPDTSRIPAFKVMQVSGAYYRGDANEKQLQRVYGTAWLDKKDLKAYLTRLEESKKRDHRRIGPALGLFHIQEEAPGSVFWHPKGWLVYQMIVNYIRTLTAENGYQEINTPQIVDRVLWERSGHWEKFHDDMFVTETESHTFAIKPMNCPCHIQVFKQGIRSYRDLPIRFSEFGSCHRNEPGGTLHGIMRVRAFVQDDAHIFCTEDQVYDEVAAFCGLVKQTYRDFGFSDVVIKMATRPEVRLGDDAIWDRGEKALEEALNRIGDPWELNPGQGAFYGPKIEYNVRDCLGRTWQLGTIQIDHNMPGRLGAKYVGEDNKPHTPVMLHRAICGSLERFVGILIEHYAGAFPLWLAPVQVRVMTVSEKSHAYGEQVTADLRSKGLRVEFDPSNDKIGPKKHAAREQKVPYIVVVGEQEAADGTVNVNDREGKMLGNLTVEEFAGGLMEEIATKGKAAK